MRPLSECRIAIVGLGLMGGSLAGALHGQCRSIVGVARREATLADARQRGWIDEGTTDPQAAVAAADLVVLATPVRTIIAQLREIGGRFPVGSLVMDVGSTKREVLEAMERLPPGIEPLGAHPMCGRETSGISEADPNLYAGCTFILCPLERTSPAALDLGRRLAEAVGATPLVLEGDRQDRLAAALSHLPYLLACALVGTAEETTSDDPAAREIIAGGYRDTSRLAGSDVQMMLDILMTNRAAVLASARAFRGEFDRLVRLVGEENEERLAAVLTASREARRRMYR